MRTILQQYTDSLKALGFKKIQESGHKTVGGRMEKLYIFFHPKYGILLHFVTYLGFQISTGNYYYNWKRGIDEGRVYKRKTKLLTEGHWSMHGERDVFVGQDFIPGPDIGRTLSRLGRSGSFVTPWIEAPHMHLPKEKIKTLPGKVRKAILR